LLKNTQPNNPKLKILFLDFKKICFLPICKIRYFNYSMLIFMVKLQRFLLFSLEDISRKVLKMPMLRSLIIKLYSVISIFMLKVTDLRRFKSFFTEQSKVAGCLPTMFLRVWQLLYSKICFPNNQLPAKQKFLQICAHFQQISLYVPTYMFCRIMYVSLVFLYNWQGHFLWSYLRVMNTCKLVLYFF
jgi:hypothetical protein